MKTILCQRFESDYFCRAVRYFDTLFTYICALHDLLEVTTVCVNRSTPMKHKNMKRDMS